MLAKEKNKKDIQIGCCMALPGVHLDIKSNVYKPHYSNTLGQLRHSFRPANLPLSGLYSSSKRAITHVRYPVSNKLAQ